MINLNQPTFRVEDLVNLCVTTVDSADLRLRILGEVQELVRLEAGYFQRGRDNELFELIEADAIGRVTVEEMKWLYTNKLARANSVGRPYYDALMLGAKGKICPYCGQRKVSTLDHYLSKSVHPAYALTPINLVPSCKDCNMDTRVRRADKKEDQTFHPYFDSVDDEIWLVASVIDGAELVVEFDVSSPATWDPVKAGIVSSHFREFGLAELYSTHAGVEMVDIYHDLTVTGGMPDREDVRAYLVEKADARTGRMRNCWQAAMYRALAASDWYCDGGFARAV